MSGKTIFITGGARSGKSSYALKLAGNADEGGIFIATAAASDHEMEERIRRHQQERGPEWRLIEEPLDIVPVLSTARQSSGKGAVILDCLTLWLANIFSAGQATLPYFEALIDELRHDSATNTYIVSNEVGLGIVPENELARKFRDEAGRLNRLVAEEADQVILTVAGIPVTIKG